MPVNVWRLSVDLDDLFSDPDNPPMERRDEIADRIRASRWPLITTDRGRLAHLLKGFANPDETDPNLWWHGLYELADTDRVWLDTDGVERRRNERARLRLGSTITTTNGITGIVRAIHRYGLEVETADVHRVGVALYAVDRVTNTPDAEHTTG